MGVQEVDPLIRNPTRVEGILGILRRAWLTAATAGVADGSIDDGGDFRQCGGVSGAVCRCSGEKL